MRSTLFNKHYPGLVPVESMYLSLSDLGKFVFGDKHKKHVLQRATRFLILAEQVRCTFIVNEFYRVGKHIAFLFEPKTPGIKDIALKAAKEQIKLTPENVKEYLANA